MPSRSIPDQPFGVLVSKQGVITKPTDVWEDGFGAVSYVYRFTVHRPAHIAIWLNDSEIEEGFAAIIYGETMEGLRVRERCYVGHLEPSKPAAFIRLAPRQWVTAASLSINIRPKLDVDSVVREHRDSAREDVPFIQVG